MSMKDRDLKDELNCDGQCFQCENLDCKNHPINNDDEEDKNANT